jgi:hypothetical protein
MLEDREYEILVKYEKGDEQDEEDREFLEQMSSVGLVTLGFFANQETAVETAGLTEGGKQLLDWERVCRNPVRRFCHIAVDALRG